MSESQELTGNYNLTRPAELPDEPLSWAWLMGGALVTLLPDNVTGSKDITAFNALKSSVLITHALPIV